MRSLRHGGSAPDFSQGFGPIIVLLTVCYVVVAAVPFLLMVDATWIADGAPGAGRPPACPAQKRPATAGGAGAFAVATLLYIIAVATVIVVGARR